MPPPDRFYCEDSLENPSVELTGPEAHHLAHVLRMKAGEQVILFDGRGSEAVAEIGAVSRRSVELRIVERRHSPDEPGPTVILGTAVGKGDRFRWLVEKATELGVERLVPLTTARSVVDPRESKLEKMRQTVIAACKQSGRNRLMEIAPVTAWNDFVSGAFPGAACLVAEPAGEPAAALVPLLDTGSPIVIAVGPEGGLTDAELAAAVENGARLVSLGPRILRVETAAVALAAFCLLHGAGPCVDC